MFAPSLPYSVIVVFWLVGAVLTGFIHITRQELSTPDATTDDVFAGVRDVPVGVGGICGIGKVHRIEDEGLRIECDE